MSKKIYILLLSVFVWHNCFATQEEEHPLFAAAKHGQTRVIKRILKQNPFTINLKDSMRRTPLHWAVENDHRRVAKLLVNAGAYVNQRDQKGNTPLASIPSFDQHSNCLQISRILLKAGAEVDTRDHQGFTPFFHALNANNLRAAHLFLHYGANVNKKDQKGQTYLHHIARYNCNECRVSYVRLQYGTVLAQNCHASIAHFLLTECEAEPNLKDNEGKTPLHLAADKGCYAIARLLLQHGADCNAIGNLGTSALYFAALHFSSETVMSLLLTAGANIDAQNCHNAAPIDAAIMMGDKNNLLFLISRGALAARCYTPAECFTKTGVNYEKEHSTVTRKLFLLLESPKVYTSTGFPRDINRELVSFLSLSWRPISFPHAPH